MKLRHTLVTSTLSLRIFDMEKNPQFKFQWLCFIVAFNFIATKPPLPQYPSKIEPLLPILISLLHTKTRSSWPNLINHRHLLCLLSSAIWECFASIRFRADFVLLVNSSFFACIGAIATRG